MQSQSVCFKVATATAAAASAAATATAPSLFLVGRRRMMKPCAPLHCNRRPSGNVLRCPALSTSVLQCTAMSMTMPLGLRSSVLQWGFTGSSEQTLQGSRCHCAPLHCNCGHIAATSLLKPCVLMHCSCRPNGIVLRCPAMYCNVYNNAIGSKHICATMGLH